MTNLGGYYNKKFGKYLYFRYSRHEHPYNIVVVNSRNEIIENGEVAYNLFLKHGNQDEITQVLYNYDGTPILFEYYLYAYPESLKAYDMNANLLYSYDDALELYIKLLEKENKEKNEETIEGKLDKIISLLEKQINE